MDSSLEKRTVTLQKNPLLIRPVIECVFEHLPLEDLKKCRVVCQEWNSVAIPILSKQSVVKLNNFERMTSFLEFYKACDTEEFPFTTFHMTFCQYDGNTERFELLIDSFKTLQENIITLIFEYFGEKLNFTPLIAMANNLVRLTLTSSDSPVELDKFEKVKYLSLIGCCVSLDSFENRIAPLSINLESVVFTKNKKKLREILINDYIDFSRCSEIKVVLLRRFSMTFDMSRDIVSAEKVYFYGIRVINWRASQTKTDKRMLYFNKHTGMTIKELTFKSSELNLSVLPKSLERLTLDTNAHGRINCVQFKLPNLKYLYFRPSSANITTQIPPIACDMGIITSMFRLSTKLVDMELCGSLSNYWHCDINVDLLPVSLKRIKLTVNTNIDFVGETVIYVDTLILERGTYTDTQRFMTKIKPKIVVVELQYCDWEVEDPENDMVSFVEESRNLEKMVIEIPVACVNEVVRSYRRALSHYLDEDDTHSNCYAFTNAVGTPLTEEEFNMYWF